MAGEPAQIVIVEGRAYRRQADGSLSPLRDETNWSKAAQQSDLQHPDDEPYSDAQWAMVKLQDPFKRPVTIRLDHDIIDWFKAQGPRYQTRINAALRLYVEAQKKAG